MLSKPVGGTVLYQLTTATGTYNISTSITGTNLGLLNQSIPARKVRVAVTSPAVINFGTAVADNNSDILMPANTVEHFTLKNTSTISYVLLTGATAGYISFTPVA